MHKQYSYKIVPTSSNFKRTEHHPPTAGDIKETKKLFKDFYIKEDIPEFKTKNELYNWRNRVIRGALNE